MDCQSSSSHSVCRARPALNGTTAVRIADPIVQYCAPKAIERRQLSRSISRAEKLSRQSSDQTADALQSNPECSHRTDRAGSHRCRPAGRFGVRTAVVVARKARLPASTADYLPGSYLCSHATRPPRTPRVLHKAGFKVRVHRCQAPGPSAYSARCQALLATDACFPNARSTRFAIGPTRIRSPRSPASTNRRLKDRAQD